MKFTTPVIFSWLFAAYWLYIGIHDFNSIRYDATGSSRYREKLPLLLCLVASLDLALLGFFISIDKRLLVLFTLSIFAIVWILWVLVAKRSWNTTNRNK